MNKLQVFCLALLVFLLNVLTGNAQNRNFGNAPQRQRIDAQKVAFFTDQLQLTPDEARIFWPIYNQYNTQKEELNQDFMRGNQKYINNADAVSDKDASDLADGYIRHAQK